MSWKTWTLESIKEVVDDFLEKAKVELAERRRHPMVVYFFCEKGIGFGDLDDMLSAAERAYNAGLMQIGHRLKKGIWESVRGVVKENDANGLLVISEVWVSHQDREKNEGLVMGGDSPEQAKFEHGMPRDDPKKREAVMVNWEFKLGGGEKVSGIAQQFFKRIGEGRGQTILFEEKSWIGLEPGEEKLEGRAVGLLS